MEQPNQIDSPQQNENKAADDIPDWNQVYLPNIPVPEDYSYLIELTQRFDIDKVYTNFLSQQV